MAREIHVQTRDDHVAAARGGWEKAVKTLTEYWEVRDDLGEECQSRG